jgi:hypothetical protein
MPNKTPARVEDSGHSEDSSGDDQLTELVIMKYRFIVCLLT